MDFGVLNPAIDRVCNNKEWAFPVRLLSCRVEHRERARGTPLRTEGPRRGHAKLRRCYGAELRVVPVSVRHRTFYVPLVSMPGLLLSRAGHRVPWRWVFFSFEGMKKSRYGTDGERRLQRPTATATSKRQPRPRCDGRILDS